MSVIWTAEIGSCHQGDKSLAYELIRQAKWAGATIAKFQLGWTKEAQAKYCSSYDERRYVDDWAEDLAKWCADLDIEFMASIWSFEGLEVARKVGMKRYKIAHQIKPVIQLDPTNDSEMANEDATLVVSALSDGKQVFQSFTNALDVLPGTTPVVALDEYPAYRVAIGELKGMGYSSHAHGIADALIAVTRGAEFVEKHLTPYKYAGFPKDASFALTPPEFKQMVEIGDEIARLR